jgi:signal transduction histidine kinase
MMASESADVQPDGIDPFRLAGLGSREEFVARLGGRAAVPIGVLLLATFLLHPSLGGDGLVLAVGLFALGVGVLLIKRPGLLPLGLLDGLLIGADVTLVFLARLGHGLEVAFPGVYLVIGVIVFALRPWPWAFTHLTLLGASYAGVLLFGPDEYAPATRWIGVMTLLAVEAIFVRWLVQTILVAGIAEHTTRRLVEATTRRLEQVSAAKSAFLAEMSHELRTPLNAIKGFTDLLRYGMAGPLPVRQRDAVQDISDAAGHLQALVDDVLDIANIEAGGLNLNREPVNLLAVVDETINLVREPAARRGIACELQATAGVGLVTADRRRVRQVLVNLLTNAVKFSPPGGSVLIRVATRADAVVVSVADRGPGIPPEDRGRVFEKFASSQHSAGGTGLGLTIARALVDAHGGHLEVDDTPGGGTTFSMTLPRSARDVSTDLPVDEPDDPLPDYSAFTIPGSAANRELILRIGARLSALSGLLVLIAGAITPLASAVRAEVTGGGCALLIGAGFLHYYAPRLTTWRIEFVRWGGIAAITAVVAVGGGLSDLIPFTYVWLTMVSFALSDRRLALAELATIAVAYGVITVVQHPEEAASRWLAVIALVGFSSEVVIWVTARLRGVIVSEQEASANAGRVHRKLVITSGHKSAFAANMSHELRTPLNAIIGFSDLLESELLGPLTPTQHEYVQDVRQAAHQLLALINDVLDVARLEERQLRLLPELVSVRDVLQGALDAAGAAARPAVRVETDVQPGLEIVFADRERLLQALREVVANALRFTPDGGQVHVAARATDAGELVLTVADTGIGFEPDEALRIFEPFHRGSRPSREGVKGAGLGLTLVKGIVELHGGQVVADSTPGGSTITMTVPALAAVNVAEAAS